MTHALKIRKGDTVHILAGKDRGKEGRVIEARPREQRVVVENLNIQKRHTRPRPMRVGRLQVGQTSITRDTGSGAGLEIRPPSDIC